MVINWDPHEFSLDLNPDWIQKQVKSWTQIWHGIHIKFKLGFQSSLKNHVPNKFFWCGIQWFCIWITESGFESGVPNTHLISRLQINRWGWLEIFQWLSQWKELWGWIAQWWALGKIISLFVALRGYLIIYRFFLVLLMINFLEGGWILTILRHPSSRLKEQVSRILVLTMYYDGLSHYI